MNDNGIKASQFGAETVFMFNTDNGIREVLRIDGHGKVTLGEGVTVDEASQFFYDAVTKLGQQNGQRVARQIDLKHHINGLGQIVKTTNGTVIEESEPTILFRGRDYLAVPLLIKYREMCVRDGCNDFQLQQMDELVERFAKFARENPKVMKQPGITRGL